MKKMGQISKKKRGRPRIEVQRGGSPIILRNGGRPEGRERATGGGGHGNERRGKGGLFWSEASRNLSSYEGVRAGKRGEKHVPGQTTDFLREPVGLTASKSRSGREQSVRGGVAACHRLDGQIRHLRMHKGRPY